MYMSQVSIQGEKHVCKEILRDFNSLCSSRRKALRVYHDHKSPLKLNSYVLLNLCLNLNIVVAIERPDFRTAPCDLRGSQGRSS